MLAASTVPVKHAARAYVIELALAQALYVLAASGRHWLIVQVSDPSWALFAGVVPALPIWLSFAAVWRYYRRIDEFEKLKFLKTLALSFGIGSCALVTYSLMEDAGLPKLAITWAWPTLAVTWALTTAIMSLAHQHAK
ncbi:MAG: hypothetical protein JO348_13660 [Alphaproteobacteria bacterium]|nr:hypothetical protein [Alphaproteobacteria bacterium]MBV9420814.1 hypothetical protein [Alphaproteobacteria bacterium]